MSRSDIIKCEVANAIVMQLWVKNLISTEERDKIIEKLFFRNNRVFLWTFVGFHGIVCPALGWAGQNFLPQTSPVRTPGQNNKKSKRR